MSNLSPESEYEQAYGGEYSISRSCLAWLTYSAIDLVSALENSSLFEKHPEYRRALRVVAVPERVIQFRIVWEDVCSLPEALLFDLAFEHTESLYAQKV